MMAYFDWSAENIATMRSMFASGKTAEEIAVTLGCPSRNSVTGKLSRLGIQRGTARKSPVPKLTVVDMVPLHIGIAELTGDTCRFPYGDANYTFCGHPPQAKSPYCGVHSRLCFNGVPAQRNLPANRDLEARRARFGGGRAA